MKTVNLHSKVDQALKYLLSCRLLSMHSIPFNSCFTRIIYFIVNQISADNHSTFLLVLFLCGWSCFSLLFFFFLQSSEFRYFVSKKWLTKFQSCMEPGNESQMPEGLWWTDLLQACNLLLAMMLTSCLVCFYRAHYKLRLHVPPWR